jgi:iron complex transport system permease protein
VKSLQKPIVLGALVLLLLVLAVASLSAGRVWVPWSAWLSAGQDPRWAIVFGLRLPRTVLAMMVGGALGLTGAVMQGYTRNPLADPGVLGVSSSAALGAVLTLYFGAAGEASWTLPVAAMVGAAIGVVILLGLAGVTSSVITFVLAGVIIQTVCTAASPWRSTSRPIPGR